MKQREELNCEATVIKASDDPSQEPGLVLQVKESESKEALDGEAEGGAPVWAPRRGLGDRWGRRYPLGLEGRVGVRQLGTPRCRVPVVLSSRRAAAWRGRARGRAAGRAQRLPRLGAVPRLPASRLPAGRPPSRSPGRRHVFRGQRERLAAPGGAAQAGGRRGEDQGLSGSCRASTILHAECLQGCPAGGCSSWKQSLSGAQILCFTLKTVEKKFGEECFQAQTDE